MIIVTPQKFWHITVQENQILMLTSAFEGRILERTLNVNYAWAGIVAGWMTL